jgi:predicted nucleic-acid-binding protein
MKYIDTNILVRIITGDNQEFANQAIAQIESAGPNELRIVDAILVELCFVLEFHTYAMARKDIAAALEVLAAAPQIVMSEDSLRALACYREHPKLDYADCLLYVLGGKHGILTFDKTLQKTLLAAE